MKKLVLIFIPALICGAMLTNCKKAEQKNNLVLTSDEIISSNVTSNEIAFVDREKDEISYREMEEVFRKWVRDQVIQRAEQRNQQAIPRTEQQRQQTDSEMEAAFRKWVRDQVIQRAEQQRRQTDL